MAFVLQPLRTESASSHKMNSLSLTSQMLWLKPRTFEMSQRGYLQSVSIIICCDQRPQHLRGHKEAICGLQLIDHCDQRPQHLRGHRDSAAFGCHSSLWPKATTIERSQIAALDWQRWWSPLTAAAVSRIWYNHKNIFSRRKISQTEHKQAIYLY